MLNITILSLYSHAENKIIKNKLLINMLTKNCMSDKTELSTKFYCSKWN